MCDCVIHDIIINGGERAMRREDGKRVVGEGEKRGKSIKNIGSNSAADKNSIQKY